LVRFGWVEAELPGRVLGSAFYGDHDSGGLVDVRRIQAQPDPTRDRHADISALQLVGADGIDYGCAELLGLYADAEVEGLGRPIQTGDMLVELEDAPAVYADTLERAIAIEEPVVVDIKPSLLARDDVAVQIDVFGHWAPLCGSMFPRLA